MPGQELSAAETPIRPGDFLASLAKAVPESTPQMRCVLLAQASLETGRFHHCIRFNLGGLKSGTDRDYSYYPTSERIPLAQALMDVSRSTASDPCKIVKQDGDRATVLYMPSHPTCRFRAYRDLDEAMVDYISLLRVKWAKAWSAAEAGDPVRFVALLHSSGYFTADPGAYSKAVVSLYREFSKLVPGASSKAT